MSCRGNFSENIQNIFFSDLTLYISCPVVPDVEVKGESAVYFLLVQGTDDAGSATCRVRMMHSHSQLNGAAAMATISSWFREKHLLSGILCDMAAEVFLSLSKCIQIMTFICFYFMFRLNSNIKWTGLVYWLMHYIINCLHSCIPL